MRFSLDEWMLRLYPLRYDDPGYAERAERCKDLIWSLAEQILALRQDVVLDWNQWSRHRRSVWRRRIESAGHHAVLHHVRVPLDLAIRRVEERSGRREPGTHPLDAAGVRHLATIFEPPGPSEGLAIIETSGHGGGPGAAMGRNESDDAAR